MVSATIAPDNGAAVGAEVKKVKRAYRMTDADRENRSKHIKKFQHLATAAAAARPPEERQRTARNAAQSFLAKYRAMKAATLPESPEDIRARLKLAEASRAKILDTLVKSAKEDKADIATVSAALRELRNEDGLLRARLKDAEAARNSAPPVPVAPVAPALPAVDPAPEAASVPTVAPD